MKILHAADLHLDSPLGGLEFYEGAPVDEVRSATRRALMNLVDFCLAEKVALLLIAGDLYDGDWRDYSTGLFFMQQMARLADVGARVVWVRGNHDAQSQITRHLAPPAHVRELSTGEPESVVFDDLGLVVHGRGYLARDTRDNILAAYPPRLPGLLNIGLLHTAVDGREPHARYAPCTLEELRSFDYDYFALGHVHAREILSTRPWVVFPGNLQGRHVREAGPKGATLIEVHDGRVLAVSRVELDVVRWQVIQVEARGGDFDAIVERAAQAMEAARAAAGGRLLAARLEVVGETEAHATLLAQAERLKAQLRVESLTFGGVYLEDVRIKTRLLGLDGATLGPEDGLGQLLANLARRVQAYSGGEAADAFEASLRTGLEAVPHDLLREHLAELPELLADAERLLVARLLDEDEAPS